MARVPALGFIFVTLFLDVLGIGLVIPVLPKLVAEFRGGDVSAASHTVGVLVALYSLLQFLCAPVLGNLSDRYGRRPVILGSLFGSGVDYLLLAWAPNLGWFFLGRMVAGITGANFTAASAYIADISPPEKRAGNFGLIGAAFGLGFIAGPAVGGLLGNASLRLPFLVAAGVTLLNWLYGLWILPESLPVRHRRSFDWRRANPLGSLLALRTYPLVLALSGTFFLIHTAQNMLHATWVLYTGYRYGWTAGQVGVSLAIVGLMAALVQGVLARRLIPALGEPRAMLMGLAISATAMVGYGWAPRGWMIYVILVFGSLGGIAGPAAQGLISRTVAMNEQGAVQGALSSLASVSGIVGPPLGAGVFGWFIGGRAPVALPGAAFFFASALMLTALTLGWRALRRHGPRTGTGARAAPGSTD
ncbi:MAG: TCR/Tet family MFS transporter [Verrucomicrobiales bacterium]|nr:TCR/Tet family MFS transporter [Verrucomicrobiales bacterium]